VDPPMIQFVSLEMEKQSAELPDYVKLVVEGPALVMSGEMEKLLRKFAR
jgi:hypothetical protein